MNFIIEGLTGSGKSQIISQLKSKLNEHQIIYEAETFGNFMLEIDGNSSDQEKIYRLEDCLAKIKNGGKQNFIVERFHFSYFPFIDNWEIYSEIDSALAALNFRVVLLTYSETLLEERALNHRGILDSIGSEMIIEYFGSKQNALSAYKNSHEKRLECLNYTKLEHIEIDTSEMDWKRYADLILEFLTKAQ